MICSVRDAYRELFASVRDRPGMYVITEGRYDVVVAFLLGCDLGNAGGLLRGFEEWLLQQYGGHRNVHWSGLIREIAFRESSDSPHNGDFTDEQHRQAVALLWELVDRFLGESGTVHDTRKIYRGYWEWQEARGMTPEV